MNITPVAPMYVMAQDTKPQTPVCYAVQDLKHIQPEQEAKPAPKHRALKTVASALIPGAGQIFDGRIGAGLGFLGLFAGLKGFSKVFSKFIKSEYYKVVLDALKLDKKFMELHKNLALKKRIPAKEIETVINKAFTNAKGKTDKVVMAVTTVTAAATLGTRIASAVNTYKGAKNN